MRFGSFIFRAALAIVVASAVGCSSQKEQLDLLPKEVKQVSQTISVGYSDESSVSKALSDKGVKTFVPGDKISVVYTTQEDNLVSVESDAIETEDISEEGRRAHFKVTLNNPKPGCNVFYVYPASMVNSTGSLDYDALNEQDGTLETIGRKLDLAIFQGQLSAQCELPATGTLENSFAILKLSILNADASMDITKYTTSLTVSDGANTYVVTPPAPATTFGDGPVYVIVAPCIPSETLTYTVGNGGTREITGKSIQAGHMYPAGLKFGSVVNLGDVTQTDGSGLYYYVAKHGDVLYGSYTGFIQIADKAAVTLEDVSVQRKPHNDIPIIRCLGDGTILLAKRLSNALITDIDCNASGIFVPKGKTLTIDGDGILEVSAREGLYGAGIGGTYGVDCGTIIIEGGTILLHGGTDCAGLGSGKEASCDGIIIRGGDVLADGGPNSAGIGCGYDGKCGDITIGPDITRVMAWKGSGALYHIGRASNKSTCGLIAIPAELDDSGENGYPDYRLILPHTTQ